MNSRLGANLTCIIFALVGVLYLLFSATAFAQQADSAATEHARQIELTANTLSRKLQERRDIAATLNQLTDNDRASAEQQITLLNNDINRLLGTFELLILGNLQLDLIELSDDSTYDWRAELESIVQPVFGSLKNITRKPRQLAQLRSDISNNELRLEIIHRALTTLEEFPPLLEQGDIQVHLSTLSDKWMARQQTVQQDLLISRNRLQQLETSKVSVFDVVGPATQEFIVGRGLTLLIVFLSVIITWLLTRLCWWALNEFVITKDTRRKSLWYRLFNYSFHILSISMCIVVAIAVLYAREDVLLMAIALLVLAAMALGLRQHIPSYLKETRLLLNMGPAREGELVMYKGMPWMIESINLYCILRNPALYGVLRLPLAELATMTSRPINKIVWFPTERHDYVILPDNTFGQIVQQTPELVSLQVKGGMRLTFPTPDFYATSVFNLSANESFGVPVTFGLSYDLQPISLTEVPQKIYKAVLDNIEDAGHIRHLVSLMVDLSSAGPSSLDYIIYGQFKKEAADSYYGLSRLMLKACIQVANEQQWDVPFPQMVVHNADKAA